MRISFRTKVVILMTSGIIILFLIIGVIFSIMMADELRREILSETSMFVQLTTYEIGDAFSRYYETGFFRFREIILHNTNLSSDLEKIQIVGLDNTIYYEISKGEEEELFMPKPSRVASDTFVLKNIKKMELNRRFENDLTIVAPYISEHGVHIFSIVYTFSLNRLGKGIAAIQRNTFFLCIGIVMIGLIISTLLSNQITAHLVSLTRAAKKVAAGDFGQVVDIRTNDEFEEVANAFNFMASELRGYVRDLKNMVNQLRKSDKEKTLFLANVSHELRTPLTASLGYVDYMEKGKLGQLTDEQAHSIKIIRRNLERLNKEIRALLDVSKYYLKGIDLKLKDVLVLPIIESTLVDFRPDIEMKDLKVHVKLRGDSDSVRADAGYLKVVFENLIGNATKFSPIGGVITIESADRFENEKKFVIFRISDQGPHIPESKLTKIFEPFYQIDSSPKKVHGGIGLGLSIARFIIETHKGRIWAESNKTSSTFSFIIPSGGKND